MAPAELTISGRRIGDTHPVYVIAELSGNHNGDLERAKALVHAAAEAKVDAIKLQTYTADTITIDCDAPPFRIEHGTLWDGRVLHELYREASTPWDWHPILAAEAEALGLHCFSSPFDATAVDFLEEHNVPAYKIASFELVDIPLIQKIARLSKPMIVSTGMASWSEITEAVNAIRIAGDPPLALLRTNSGYPASPKEMDLVGMEKLAELGVVVGLSDHTLGHTVAVAAVALGARIIEKHLTMSRDDGGPDAAFSLEPKEFAELVDAARTAQDALGRARFGPTERERSSLNFRRSLFVVKDVAAGEALSHESVRSIRPSHGLHPRYLDAVVGRIVREDVARGTPLSWEHLQPPELTLTEAQSADAKRLFEWANDPGNRAASFSSDVIEWDEHVAWLEKKLSNSDCSLFIVSDAQGPLAQVRFDDANDHTVISLSLAPERRGEGLASAVIEAAVKKASAAVVHAFIKPDNVRSIRAFERAGFAERTDVEVQGCPALRLRWSTQA